MDQSNLKIVFLLIYLLEQGESKELSLSTVDVSLMTWANYISGDSTDCSCNGESAGKCWGVEDPGATIPWCYVGQNSGCPDKTAWIKGPDVVYFSEEACKVFDTSDLTAPVEQSRNPPESRVDLTNNQLLKATNKPVRRDTLISSLYRGCSCTSECWNVFDPTPSVPWCFVEDDSGCSDIAPKPRTANKVFSYQACKEKNTTPRTTILTILTILGVAFIILSIRKIHTKRKLKNLEMIVQKMLTGDKNIVDPGIPITDQVELLSYDDKYEIDYENISFGDRIGNGKFGRVHVATATGIFESEDTIIAIKEVKNITNNHHLESLIGELKIMSRLGSHINLVNLLAASTTEVAINNVNLLLEYCLFGVLHTFLKENKSTFITNLNNEDEADTIHTPKMLLNWCHDVSKGMEYLEEKKIMHGDLAARNVLLDEGYLAKITNIGLAKQKTGEQAYKKLNQRRFPWAWMAIEFLKSGEFSLASDVWSFGVFVWEVYSLGANPYGSESFQDMKQKLLSGYRIPTPDLMSELDGGKQLYNSIMVKCWLEQPSQRPSFKQLADMLANMMEKEDMDYYEAKVKVFNRRMEKIKYKEERYYAGEDVETGKHGYMKF